MTSCANIGPLQRRRRLWLGLAGLAGAVALAIAFAATSAPAVLRAIVFLPLVLAGYGFFQHREKT